MLPSSKVPAALYAIQSILVKGRCLAAEGADHHLLSKLLDWAEILPSLITFRDEDTTEEFRQALAGLGEDFPDCFGSIEDARAHCQQFPDKLRGAPRSRGTPASPRWADPAPGACVGRTSQSAALRRHGRELFPPPREANETCPMVTEDALDELARSKAGKAVRIREPSRRTCLAHR